MVESSAMQAPRLNIRPRDATHHWNKHAVSPPQHQAIVGPRSRKVASFRFQNWS